MHANLEGKRWRMETSEISYILVPFFKLIDLTVREVWLWYWSCSIQCVVI